MADIHHFSSGVLNPTLAYAISFLGSLLGLTFTARARQTTGWVRARWLVPAGIAIGGVGVWMMHFVAMLGFDVPESIVRYDARLTVDSLVIAVAVVTLGLFAVGFGQPSMTRIWMGGLFTGLGVVTMHYVGMSAMRVGGAVAYDLTMVTVSVAVGVVASTAALWCAVVIDGPRATIAAALVMGIAVCSMHYTAMAAVRVRLYPQNVPVAGVNPFELLLPISIVGCLVIGALAFVTVGFSGRPEGQSVTRVTRAFRRPSGQ